MLVLQLTQALLVTLLVLAVVLALRPQGAADELRFRRRRAEWTTVAVVVVAVWLLLLTGRALLGPDGPNPLGVLPFLLLAVHALVGWLLVRRVWRRVVALQVEVAEDHATDPSPRPHGGLSGGQEPPRRW